ncbi:MAG: glycosyltransferase [Candidatus Gastranaerophilaceae bacterium]
MPKVSIIIPVYNTEKYLRKCLDSVCNQTLSDIEILCINDCSTDNSLQILQEYASIDNRIRIIDFEENKGAAVARNTGINEVQGEYIGFVDSDDYVDSDFFEKLYFKAKDLNSNIVKGNLILENSSEQDLPNPYPNLLLTKQNKFLFNHVPTAIYLKTYLNEYGIRYPENISCLEDTVFEAKVSCYTPKIDVCPEISYHYVYNSNSLNNSSKFSDKKIKDTLKAFEQIVDFYNTVNLPEKFYIECLNFRYKALYDMAIAKFNDNLKQIELFEKISEGIEQKFKYNIDISFKKLDFLKFIASKRIIPTAPKNKIDKRIFYVWLGNKKSISAEICIDNWREHLPGYEIIEVNEKSNYFDFEQEYKNCKWFKEIYDRKMWAFVSDYIRCIVLYNYGGIYLDTDITIKKDFEPLLKCDVFVGEESVGVVNASVIGSVKGHPIFADMLNFYQNYIYDTYLATIPDIMTKIISDNLYDNITILPKEYFYPYPYKGTYSPECIKGNTYTVHWWNASWTSPQNMYFLEKKQAFAKIRKMKLTNV